MLLGIEIYGMHLAFRSAHVSTLANEDDEMKPYLFGSSLLNSLLASSSPTR